MDATEYRFLTLALPSFDAVTNSTNSVFINDSSAFISGEVKSGFLNRDWTPDKLRSLILLHE